MNKINIVKCQNCGANLKQEKLSSDKTLTCEYCGAVHLMDDDKNNHNNNKEKKESIIIVLVTATLFLFCFLIVSSLYKNNKTTNNVIDNYNHKHYYNIENKNNTKEEELDAPEYSATTEEESKGEEAKNVEVLDQSITKVTNTVLSMSSYMGIIIVLLGLFRFAIAYNSYDSEEKINGIRLIITGALLIVLRTFFLSFI